MVGWRGNRIASQVYKNEQISICKDNLGELRDYPRMAMKLLSLANGFLPHPSYLPRKLGIPATVINGGDGKAAGSAPSVEVVIACHFGFVK